MTQKPSVVGSFSLWCDISESLLLWPLLLPSYLPHSLLTFWLSLSPKRQVEKLSQKSEAEVFKKLSLPVKHKEKHIKE